MDFYISDIPWVSRQWFDGGAIYARSPDALQAAHKPDVAICLCCVAFVIV